MDIEKLIKNPPAAFRGVPLWDVSAAPSEQEIRRQVEHFARMGMGGVVLHAADGLQTRYLGQDWMQLTHSVKEEAEKNGLRVFVCDEDGEQSGRAGGLAVMHPNYRAKSLTYELVEGKTFDFATLHGNFVAAYGIGLKKVSGKQRLVYYYRIEDNTQIKGNDPVLAVFVAENSPRVEWNGSYAPDAMNRAALECFWRATMEKYRFGLGDEFAAKPFAVFSFFPSLFFFDETAQEDGGKRCAFTEDAFAFFQSNWGYDLRDRLPELFFLRENENYSKVAAQYRETCMQLYEKNWLAPYAAKLKQHKLLLAGVVGGPLSATGLAAGTGSALRCFAYADVPVFDQGAGNGRVAARQAVSAATQFGKAESGALIAPQRRGATLSSYKRANEDPIFDGVTTRFETGFRYSVAQSGKRNPSDLSYSSAFTEDWGQAERYFSALSAFFAQTRAAQDVLIVHPNETVWGKWVCKDSRDDEEAQISDLAIEELSDALSERRTAYAFADEEALAVAGKANGSRLVVGEASYRCVVVCGAISLRATTEQLLAAFAARGGKVYVVGEAPQRLDGDLIPFAKTALGKRAIVCKDAKEFASQMQSKLLKIETKSPYKTIEVAVRESGKQTKWLFLRNTSKREIGEVVCKIDGEYLPIAVSLRTGKEERVSFSFEGESTTVLPCVLQGGEERLYRLDRCEKHNATRKSEVVDDREFEIVPLAEHLGYRLGEPNVLLLDVADVTVNGESKGKMELRRLAEFLENAYGLPPKEGIRPYYKKEILEWNDKQPICDLSCKFTFEVKRKSSKMRLVIERPDCFDIYLNGRKVPLSYDGAFPDSETEKINLPSTYFAEGKNELVLVCKYGDRVPLEPIYLLGMFGVYGRTGEDGYDFYTIDELPATLAVGDVTEQGLPFYGGKIYYFLPLVSGYYRFSFPIRATWSTLTVSTKADAKKLVLPPYLCELAVDKIERDYVRSEEVGTYETYEYDDMTGVKITVSLSRRNQFGPHHTVIRDGAEAFVPEACVVPAGLSGILVERLIKGDAKFPKSLDKTQ